jgi:hypothetical protein
MSMKVRALVGLSGPFGSQVAGSEFEIDNELVADLKERKLVEPLEAVKVVKPKPVGDGAAKE